MSYEEQLSAARFRAERDLARQELYRARRDAENMRVDLCSALVIDVDTGWSDAMADMAARLMPEGYEWPRYESGEPLRYEDRYVYDGREREVWHVDFDSYGEPTILNKDGTRFHPDKGERVKRPAPKVLDADGVEIYKGRIAYGTRGRKYRVTELCEYEPSIVHAQAIDDGELGDEFIAANTGLNSYQLDASKLTHERPEIDSWERLEEDATRPPRDYCGMLLNWAIDPGQDDAHYIEGMAEDLVRRCRALAERERGEQ